MSDPRDYELPIIEQDQGSDPSNDPPSCSPEVYVTNEEASLLAAMRAMKGRATEIRERLSDDPPAEQQTILLAELEELRTRRTELARRRDRAYRRKMVMLGHLPPDVLED
jgi:hypothetical protein